MMHGNDGFFLFHGLWNWLLLAGIIVFIIWMIKDIFRNDK